MPLKDSVLVIKPLPVDQMQQLADRYDLIRLDHADDADERAAMLSTASEVCEVLLTNGSVGLAGLSPNELPKLKLVCCSSAGYEGIDKSALDNAGVILTSCSDALCDEVADTAMMLLLAARRDLRRADLYVRSGQWQKDGPYPLQQAQKGAKLGLVGAGNTGQAIGRRATAMEMQVAYFGRRKRDDVPYEFKADLTELAEWADILVLAIAGGAETRHLINAEVLAALGSSGTLINIARGSVVDEEALIYALENNIISNAGLDVFASEPDADPRLTSLENVTLYPHLASGTVQTRYAMAQSVVESIDAYFSSQPLRYRI